jgi:small subunit ribosomal protein S6
MTRTYELVLVFDPGLEVEQIENELRKVNDALANVGSVRRWERWGKRRLAFEIKGRQYGYYALVVFDGNPSTVAELERSVRINPSTIRHLITVVDPKRVPDVDAESVRTLGAAPETTPAIIPEEAPLPLVEAVVDPEAVDDIIAPEEGAPDVTI